MKKKVIILTAVFCGFGLLFLLNYLDGGILVRAGRPPVEQLIIKSIKLQYSAGDNEELNRVFTSDFIDQIASNPNFYRKSLLFGIEKDFVKTMKELNHNQAMVVVRVHDSLGSYFQEITLTKASDGSYKVSDIGLDI